MTHNMMFMEQAVKKPVNRGAGWRTGENHPRAVLTDSEVERLLNFHDSGIGYRQLARMFEISRSQVRNYCKGRQRCQIKQDSRR